MQAAAKPQKDKGPSLKSLYPWGGKKPAAVVTNKNILKTILNCFTQEF